MKIHVASIVYIDDDKQIIGVYTNYDVALKKLDKKMEELMDKNEELGCYPEVESFDLDDVPKDDYV